MFLETCIKFHAQVDWHEHHRAKNILFLFSIDPLVDALESRSDALFSAPFCLGFDDHTYEGMRTRVRDRFGLIQGLCRIPGHEIEIHRADLTASAGPVLAVDRLKFLDLGGYDPI